MTLAEIFKVFSRRPGSESKTRKPLTTTFKARVFMRCREVPSPDDFWREIHVKLAYLHGRYRLSDVDSASRTADVVAFLSRCEDAYFLDFLEYVFQTHPFRDGAGSDPALIDDINEFFRQDDLPYALTNFVWEESEEQGYITWAITSRPQIIRKDSEVMHDAAVVPTLNLLREAEFAGANKEFLEALDDFRKGDYGDCLTKCGSSFESVLKVVCARNRWPYDNNDTAAPLLRTVVARAGIDTFFEQPLILVATIRNKLSNSHGAGTVPRQVTEEKAQYAVNATAAAILFLVKATR